MSTVVGVTLECTDVDRLAAFWLEALECTSVPAPSSGIRIIELPSGDRTLRLRRRRVTSPKVIRNRMRLDLETKDLEFETARLIALGAMRIADGLHIGGRTTFADIEGNEFDLVVPKSGEGVTAPLTRPGRLDPNIRDREDQK